MLLLGSRTVTVDGITVFSDHADPNQFWYLPGPVQLARREGRAVLTFIKYKPAAVAGGAKGGGFLIFEVNLRLDPGLERRILSKLRSVAPGQPKLAVVPFDEGTVQCVALNVQGAGGTVAQPAGPGSFSAVERILGASVPSLHGDNNAAFSLTLSQEGATILEKAFEQGTEPVGVIYDLKFTGMRPALSVEITANLERVYNQLSAGLEAQVYFIRAGIDAAFEKLVQDGAIKIRVLDFTGEDDEKEKERWALDFFKENLLRQWFEPTLTPGQVAGGGVQPDLDSVLRRGNELRPPTPPAPPRPGPPETPTPTPPARPPTQDTGQGGAPGGLNPRPPASPPAAGAGPTDGTGFPTASDMPPPPAAVGVSVPPSRAASLPASLTSAPGGAGSPALVSFKLRFVRQEERKQITVRYDRSEATQRTYAPQGFFGLLVADLDRRDHFVSVDLDDPFFRVFTIAVEAPIDFGRIGLTSAQVSVDYGDPADPANLKHGDFLFDATRHDAQKFEVFMNEKLDTSYQYTVQYHFDPVSGWGGSRFSYDFAEQRTEDRTLLLNPFGDLGFLDVSIQPSRVDWGVVDSIDVELRHSRRDETTLEDTLTLTQASSPRTWKVRLDDPAVREYSYRCVHHLKDGTIRETGPVLTRAALVPVDDPFPRAIEMEFLPLFESSKVRKVYIDIEYDDFEKNKYKRAERLEIAGDATDSARLNLAQVDPELRTYRYRFTFIGTDNSLKRGPWVSTTETLIPVQEVP